MIKRLKYPLALIFIVTVIFSQDNPHKNISIDCDQCHTTAEWDQVQFNHLETGFELLGQHKRINCTSCHNISNFSETNNACNYCHTDIHQGKLYADCSQCHNPQNWTIIDANKAHSNTPFQIIGAHAKLDCNACHKDILAEFRLPSSDCIDCHHNDYLNAQNPQHTVSDFGQRCEDCHSLFSWRPATFRGHDSQFPIFSGRHSNVWDTCAECHNNSTSYTDFSCTHCHAHRRSAMDSKHRERSDYIYESQACYNCHPRGGG